jgi:hypothetical protein
MGLIALVGDPNRTQGGSAFTFEKLSNIASYGIDALRQAWT